MKELITTALFAGLMTFGATAQTASIPGGAPQDIIFRGFDNVIYVNDNEAMNRKFNVEIEGGEISVIQANDGTTNQGRYLIAPGTTNNLVLVISDNEGNEMNRYEYKVSRLPDSDVRFATVDGEFSIDEPKLVLENVYPFFETQSEITSWKVEQDGNVIGSGNGNEIDMLTMGQLSLLSEGTKFEVKVVLLDTKGISRIRTVACTK